MDESDTPFWIAWHPWLKIRTWWHKSGSCMMSRIPQKGKIQVPPPCSLLNSATQYDDNKSTFHHYILQAFKLTVSQENLPNFWDADAKSLPSYQCSWWAIYKVVFLSLSVKKKDQHQKNLHMCSGLHYFSSRLPSAEECDIQKQSDYLFACSDSDKARKNIPKKHNISPPIKLIWL